MLHRPPATQGPIDAVITWVDGSWPGYQSLIRQYSAAPADTDPSRTRDNLDLLRYGLRALSRHAPWINTLYLVTCRPQVPRWMEAAHPRLRLVHHDEIMPPALLPTFNSFAIISHLHLVPGLSERFLYLEDDMLLLKPVTPGDFCDDEGKLVVFEHGGPTPRHDTIRNPARQSPWNLALAEANRLLDKTFGPAQRRYVNHVPLLIEKGRWQAMTERFPAAFAATRGARFRAAGNVPPEYLYPHLLLAEGLASRASAEHLRNSCGYVPLEDFSPVTRFAFWRLARQRPRWVTLNDNFGQAPNPATVRLSRRFLEAIEPQPSPFERA